MSIVEILGNSFRLLIGNKVKKDWKEFYLVLIKTLKIILDRLRKLKIMIKYKFAKFKLQKNNVLNSEYSFKKYFN